MRRTRVVALAAALGLLAALIPTQAQAATGGPFPVTALPSGLYDWVPPGQPSNPAFAYKSTATATTTELAQTPNRTPAQEAALRDSATPVTYPTKIDTFKKGLDTGTQLYGEYAFGAQIGAGIVDLFGLDANGLVCRATTGDLAGKMVSILSGQTCDRTAFAAEFTPNTDASGDGFTMSPVTLSNGTKLTFKGVKVYEDRWGAATACFSADGPLVNLNGGFVDADSVVLHYEGYPQYQSYTNPNNTKIGPRSNRVVGDNTATPGCSSPEAPVIVGQADISQARAGAAAFVPKCITWNRNNYETTSCSDTSNGTVVNTATPAVANPTRQLECVVTGSDGIEYVGKSASFTELDDVFSVPECPALPDGVTARTVSVRDTAGAKNTLWKQDITGAGADALSDYPECADGTCILDLRKAGKSCFSDPAPCAGWYTDPTKATTYTCHYGDHGVELSECNLYAPTFKKLGTTVYGDPDTGMTSPNTDAGGSAGCASAGWSSVFNPGELLDGLTCNLASLFIPSSDGLSNHLADLDIGWTGTAPGSLTGVLTSWDFKPSATGCAGIPINFPTQGHEPVAMTWPNACEGEFFAPVAGTSRVALTIVFLLGAGIIAYNTVGSTFGAAPIRFGKGDGE